MPGKSRISGEISIFPQNLPYIMSSLLAIAM